MATQRAAILALSEASTIKTELMRLTSEAITNQKLDHEMLQKFLSDRLSIVRSSEVRHERLKRSLNRKNDGFSRLLKAKPGLVEKRINDATKKYFSDFADLSRVF
jgi:hypothetical protein